MTSVDIELELVLLPEYEPDLACEGTSHPLSLYGHVAEAPAKWLVVLLCGHDWLACDGWVQYGHEFNGGLWYHTCSTCGGKTLSPHVKFLPLDG